MDNQHLLEIGRKRLIAALKNRDMTASELSRKTNLAKSTISRYLKGQSVPKQPQILVMAQVLDVNPTWLMGYDAPMDGLDYALLANKNEIMCLFENMSPSERNEILQYAEFVIARRNTNKKSDN